MHAVSGESWKGLSGKVPHSPRYGAKPPLPVIAGPIPRLLPRPQSRIPEPVPVPASALADEKS